MPFEVQVVSDIQQFMMASPLLLSLSIFLARWLILIYLLFAIFLLSTKKPEHRHAVIEAAWSVVLVLVVTAIIAYFVQRARPFLGALEPGFPITRLIPEPLNTSFPSGHTGTSFAMAAAIFYAHRRLGIAALLVALLVAFGRVTVGVHYPLDILGGVVVGLGCFMFVRFLHRQLRRRDIGASARHHRHT